MEPPIQHRGDRGGVAEERAPVLDGAVEVGRVEARSSRRMMISRRSPAGWAAAFRMPTSSMMSSGTVARWVRSVRRVLWSCASAPREGAAFRDRRPVAVLDDRDCDQLFRAWRRRPDLPWTRARPDRKMIAVPMPKTR